MITKPILLIIFLFIIITIQLSILDAYIKQNFNYSQNNECVIFTKVSSGGSQIRLNFFNACGEARYVFVCVRDSSGESKMHRSVSRVPTNGKFELYLLPWEDPRGIQFRSNRNAGAYFPCEEN